MALDYFTLRFRSNPKANCSHSIKNSKRRACNSPVSPIIWSATAFIWKTLTATKSRSTRINHASVGSGLTIRWRRCPGIRNGPLRHNGQGRGPKLELGCGDKPHTLRYFLCFFPLDHDRAFGDEGGNGADRRHNRSERRTDDPDRQWELRDCLSVLILDRDAPYVTFFDDLIDFLEDVFTSDFYLFDFDLDFFTDGIGNHDFPPFSREHNLLLVRLGVSFRWCLSADLSLGTAGPFFLS